MIINCQEIYSQFLQSITEYEYLKMETNDIYENLMSYLKKSISQTYILSIFSKLTLKEEILEIEATLKYNIFENDSETDKNFIINLLSESMIIAWLQPKVVSSTNVSQMFGGKEQKFYSQATHLAEISKLLELKKSDVRKLVRDYSYINNGYLRKNK